MAKEIHEYGLDLHCSMILQEYRENLPMYNRLRQIVLKQLEGCLKRSHLVVSGLEARVKQEESLREKLIRKQFYLDYDKPEEALDNLHDLIGITVQCRFIRNEMNIYH